ncbi:UDP-N-acetylmuramoyl-L-alanine--D-glutamate ligase [Marinomonas ostreistagni]|uniref:UDP-N-acetylmuramoylalanine--D-glutamate ligase n=1 Tax=Marinomonas ostreistagni TaxID=359209 RepID=A0ABS0ZDS8_9GAMM|nr:UDP-N-acetylmuramoyl-L-alanine--D-glutamate ligase [Marinomonas ostreistagni]MBJ7551816.1 UDP-N-acetylmuramoyl-L-alanine--D-glutamate ligase [Marinomonas ostreistagni]
MSLISSDRIRAVVGLGVTGVSTAKFLAKQGLDFYVVDSRENPPGLDQVKSICPAERIFTGSLEHLKKLGVTELFVSPGIALATPVLKELAEDGVTMRGDVDLFCDYANAPFIAITGSNAKSTVTTLVNELLVALGKKSVAGGNLGLPALDCLAEGVDVYVLELSSFQLETSHALKADVACLLNVSEDHMDRYDDLYSYQRAKQRIYRGCKAAVCNKQDILTAPLLAQYTPVRAFTKGSPDLKEFGLLKDPDGTWLSHGVKRLYNTNDIKLKGEHNYANVLACLAILDVMGLPTDAPEVAQVLASFSGLAHRCETVRELEGVIYINDSKGTNVGATLAALEGLGSKQSKNIHLLAGGVGKGADFSPLAPALSNYVCHFYVFGKDADQIIDIVPAGTDYTQYQDLTEVMEAVKSHVKEGDIVLFSPACASFDQYKNFEARGNHFIDLVNQL